MIGLKTSHYHIIDRMPTSPAQKEANRKYYEKVRDKRVAQMRDAYREREAQRRAFLVEHPEAQEEEREERRERYHQHLERKQRVIIGGWLSDPDLCDPFKGFLRTCVLPAVGKGLPKCFLDMCWEYLAIATPNAGNPPNIIGTLPVDGADATPRNEFVQTGEDEETSSEED